MALLNVAKIAVLMPTAVAPLSGTVETTVGAATVVKVHTKLVDKGGPRGFSLQW
jgi:hypothetical protein